MLCIINCQYTHNQGKFCQNFQFFHIYTSFSINLHHFPVEKPNFGQNHRNFGQYNRNFGRDETEFRFWNSKSLFARN